MTGTDRIDADVFIVGGGPAGMTAATYLRRFHRSCVVFDAGASRALQIPESNNCPGFPGGVSGEALLQRMRQQAVELDVPIHGQRVDRLERRDDGFAVETATGKHHARMVVLATGVVDRLPDVDWADSAIEVGALRLCAVCDAFEATDMRIGVYGKGADIAAHARFLRTYSRHVHALPTDGGDGGEAGAEARALGVQWMPGGGELGFDGRHCHYQCRGGARVVLDTVYPYLGTTSATAMAAAVGAVAGEAGEIAVDAHQQTRVAGLYAIGDIVSGLNQIAVAVGHAAIAATHAHNQLPLAQRN